MNSNPKEVVSKALEPPKGSVIPISAARVEQVIAQSRSSARRRMILPFHRRSSEILHRMLNALQLGSYVRPHRHLHPPKAESVVVLRGCLGCVTFSDSGGVKGYWRMSRDSSTLGIDIAAGVFHTFLALEADTVMFEVKSGPFDPINDKDFAAWAPAEGEARASDYLEGLCSLFAGGGS